jgi:deoxyadenosine/deoxycytidine kinase
MKIGFCGTMSVGKTTLVNALKELPEFKDYHFATERSKYLRDLGIPLNTDSTILGQTIFLAERCSELIRENVITDRTVIDVMAFTQASNSIPTHDKLEFITYAQRFIENYDYIFYIKPDGIEIEDNNIRTIDPQYRQYINDIIGTMLHSVNDDIYIIQGSTEERIKQIMNIIKF